MTVTAERPPAPAEPPLYPQSTGEDGRERLDRAWAPARVKILREPNNTVVGLLYIGTGLMFFLAAGVLALLMRIQLAFPDQTFLSAAVYNQVFTMHGTTMMFLFAVPIVEAFAVLVLPGMLGTRDMPFPWLSAFGYWCYAIGGTLVFSTIFFGIAPDGGWFMYPPLTGATYSPGINTDVWILGLGFVEIAAVAAAVEIIVGILKTRAPGMTLANMPIFAWYMLVTAGMIMLGMPAVIAADILLELERAFDMPFYDATKGGDPLLWQHLFWLFGHPEVYIIFLPAAGMVSMMLPAFARAKLVGYAWIVMAAVAIGFLSFGLWVHHMYTTGLPVLSVSFFAAASTAIAIPMGVQIFAWLATLWDGRPQLRTPLLFICGFLFIFVLGGLTGVMVAAVPFDWQAHDTYFIVAHLHYVLIGGMVFPIFAALYYWAPMVTGRLMSERLGRVAFWLMFIGFNFTFLPMHITGLRGMPRRVYTYSDDLGLNLLNLWSSVFAFVFAAGVLLVFFDLWQHRRTGKPAGNNPFGAPSLEWLSANSPVGMRSLPIINSRYPLWDEPGLPSLVQSGHGYLPDAPTGERQSLVTGPITGEPQQILTLPGPSILPFAAALAVAVGFTAMTLKSVTIGATAGGISLVLILIWLWGLDKARPQQLADAGHGLALTMYRNDDASIGWWAMIVALIADSATTAAFVFAYLFLWTAHAGHYPPAGQALTSWWPAIVTLGLTALAWLSFEGARRRNQNERRGAAMLLLAICLISAAVAGIVAAAWLGRDGISPTEHSYGATLWLLAGWVVLHLAMGAAIAGWCLLRMALGMIDAWRSQTMTVLSLYWRFTVPMAAVLLALIAGFPHVSR